MKEQDKAVRFFDGDREVNVTNIKVRGTGCLVLVVPYLLGFLVFGFLAIYTVFLIVDTFIKGLNA